MAELIRANNNDKILDPTCGSGALLIKSMFLATKNDIPVKRKKFFTNNVFGIENSPQIVSLCYINIITCFIVKVSDYFSFFNAF